MAGSEREADPEPPGSWSWTEESGTEGWAGNPRQCCQWQHPQLDQLAVYQDLQAQP
jgi:hypothetical protein